MFSIFTHDMKAIRDTNSEPGLPVGKLALFMRFGTFIEKSGRQSGDLSNQNF